MKMHKFSKWILEPAFGGLVNICFVTISSAGAILSIPFVKYHLALFIEGKKTSKEQQLR